MSNYRSGAIWLISLEPQVGSEIKKTRPGLIVSKTEFNQRRQKITVLPFTTTVRSSQGAATFFVAKSSTNGLNKDSELITIDPATFDKQGFVRYLGELESELITLAKGKLALYLNF